MSERRAFSPPRALPRGGGGLAKRTPSVWRGGEARPDVDCPSNRFAMFWPGLRDATAGLNRAQSAEAKADAARALADLARELNDCPDRVSSDSNCARCRVFATAKATAAAMFFD